MTTKKPRKRTPDELFKLLQEDGKMLLEVAEDVARHPEKYPDEVLVLAPDQVREIFTAERTRLLEALRKRGSVESVGELADALRRAISRVSVDLAVLERHGLVQIERVGRAKRVSAQHRPILVW